MTQIFTVDEIRNRVSKELGEFAGLSGSVMYSGIDTLCQGDIYLMGLNPGGDPGVIPQTALQTIDSVFKVRPDFSAYLDEDWRGGLGQHQHQKRVVDICSLLGVDVRTVFSANAVFVRPGDAATLAENLGNRTREVIDCCLRVHDFFLAIVRPKIVVCLGNGEGASSFAILRNYLGSPESHLVGKTFRDGKYCDASPSWGRGGCRIIGAPHPSRFTMSSQALRGFSKEQRRVGSRAA